MTSKPVLVTGATGFTGQAVVTELLRQGVRVRAMVRNAEQATKFNAQGVETVIADLAHPDSLEAAVAGAEAVIHIAAVFRQAGLPASEYFKVNRDGTHALLELSHKYGVARFVHCSTVGVLGHIQNPPATEEAEYNPGDVYQISKLEGEQLALSYFNSGKLNGVVIRPAMICGPGDSRTLKLFKTIARRRFFYVGHGRSLVHFVDVRDLARAFASALGHREVSGEVFIVAGKRSLPLKELVARVSAILNVPEPKLHIPLGPMYLAGFLCEAVCLPFRINPPIFRRRVDFFTKSRSFDSSKAARLLNYEPSQSLDEELIDIIESYIEGGYISGTRFRQPAKIVRALDGSIRQWDERAEETYGWKKEQAVGGLTHSLLRTVFPRPLSEINSILTNQGEWIGNLRHEARTGSPLNVLSRWQMNPELGEGVVIEVNRARDEQCGPNSERPIAAWASSIPFLAPQELLDQLIQCSV